MSSVFLLLDRKIEFAKIENGSLGTPVGPSNFQLDLPFFESRSSVTFLGILGL